MDSKTKTLTILARDTAAQSVSSIEHWLSFMETSGRLFYLPYAEQLLAFAQRPNAVACYTLEEWRDKGFLVHSNAQAIAVLGEWNGTERVKYLFDATDVGPMRGTRPFRLWNLDEKGRADVLAFLPSENSGDFEGCVMQMAQAAAQDYFWAGEEEILQVLANNADFDADQMAERFTELAAASAAYAVVARAGGDLRGPSTEMLRPGQVPGRPLT